MPDALELPGMLGAVVELVRGERLAGIRRRVVDELVALASRHAVRRLGHPAAGRLPRLAAVAGALDDLTEPRSEEHTSELQSRRDLVCRLLLEKKYLVILGHPVGL